MNSFKKAILVGLVFVGSSFGSAMITSVALATDESDQSVGRDKVTTDLDRAEEYAGYELVEPENMPKGMERRNFTVSGHMVANQKAQSVHQHWDSNENSLQWINVVQGPEEMGLIGSHATTILEFPGERILYDKRPERPYEVVALYWNEDRNHFGVVGALVGEQTEKVLRGIAESIASRKD